MDFSRIVFLWILGFSPMGFATQLSQVNSALHCKITEGTGEVYRSFEGGQVSIELQTGATKLTHVNSSGQPIQFWAISDRTVSSYEVNRKTCDISLVTGTDSDGKVKAIRHDFDNCTTDDLSAPAHVSASQRYDFDTNRGVHSELFYNGAVTETPGFEFQDCELN